MAYESWRGYRERYGGPTSGDWRNAGRERGEGLYYGSRGWSPEGEYFTDMPPGYSGEGYLGERYRGSAPRVDYERNWGNEGRNYYGDRDYYGDREHAGQSRRGSYGAYGSDVDYQLNHPSRVQDIGARDIRNDYRGRGPRDYRRSDERIREDVCDALTDDDRIDASDLDVTIKDGEVTLTGTIDSREQKRRAEDLAERISGVTDVHNRLRVASESRRSEMQKGEPSSPMVETTTARTERH